MKNKQHYFVVCIAVGFALALSANDSKQRLADLRKQSIMALRALRSDKWCGESHIHYGFTDDAKKKNTKFDTQYTKQFAVWFDSNKNHSMTLYQYHMGLRGDIDVLQNAMREYNYERIVYRCADQLSKSSGFTNFSNSDKKNIQEYVLVFTPWFFDNESRFANRSSHVSSFLQNVVGYSPEELRDRMIKTAMIEFNHSK